MKVCQQTVLSRFSLLFCLGTVQLLNESRY